MINAIDSMYLAVADLDAACRPYERLGLRPSPARDGRRTLHIGGPANPFAVHFLADGRDGPLAPHLRRALAAGRSLFAVGLGVADLDAILGHLESRGIEGTRGSDAGGEMAWLPLHDRAGVDLVLVRQTDAVPDGLLDHVFPLKRLDHLAAIAHDLEERTRFWAECLGVPVTGEVPTPAMLIRQLRIGDAVLELLGPTSAESPLHKRPAGLISMASWEVADLDAVIRMARVAGFMVAEPAAGVLPGTRTATINGAELAGVNMQLLQYT